MGPDFISVFPNNLSSAMCDEAVRITDEICERGAPGYEFIDTSMRKDHNLTVSSFDELAPLHDQIKRSLAGAWASYNLTYEVTGNPRDFDVVYDPTTKIQKSGPGQGFTGWHTEQGGHPVAKSRICAWMIYLNDVEAGGHTEFKFLHKRYKPTKGTLLIWPAAFTHMHRAAPDLQENKYIATGWFRYP